jgi:Zn finger protein HypA/HybF involved in hydrogenase expression
MHELSIAQNIITIIQSELPKYNFSQVKFISLRIGVMRQVVLSCILVNPSTIIADAGHISRKGCYFRAGTIRSRKTGV